ncbi:DUF2490 domain-containing protein [Flavobacterium sp.]|uniref:DUF2490 domain-containing protein n=1 Tax=Flavobacterium sp. TaxID=239 RepID=UPI00286E8CBC|nr:DUF2490 domain-containing protein [Flavobacterium sp.]
MKLYLLTIALISLNFSFAQYSDLGSWNILNLKYKFDKKWSVFGETQLRSLGFYDDFHYYEYKAAVNYKFQPSVLLTIGAGSYQTFQDGGDFVTPKKNNEFRVWPQITNNQSIGKIIFEQRLRTELRFTSDEYRNRFRYRLGLSYPFGKKNKNFKPFQIAISDELFFTNKEPYFERNRTLVTFNFKPTKATTLQLGYVHQFDYKINDETGRDFLLIGYFVELFAKDFKK